MRMNYWKVSTIVLAAVLGVLGARASIREASAEVQPHMQAALNLLQMAEQQLAAATDDKGGHRVKAMEHAKQATAEVKKGIEFDNKH